MIQNQRQTRTGSAVILWTGGYYALTLYPYCSICLPIRCSPGNCAKSIRISALSAVKRSGSEPNRKTDALPVLTHQKGNFIHCQVFLSEGFFGPSIIPHPPPWRRYPSGEAAPIRFGRILPVSLPPKRRFPASWYSDGTKHAARMLR